jgi:hypothetical protein
MRWLEGTGALVMGATPGIGVGMFETDYDYRMTDVNINGVVLVTKYALPHMVAQRSGAISLRVRG